MQAVKHYTELLVYRKDYLVSFLKKSLQMIIEGLSLSFFVDFIIVLL